VLKNHPQMLLRNILKTKFNASTDYLVVFIIINLGVVIMSTISGFSAYKNSLDSNHQILEREALKAENIITEAINEHAWQIRSLADKIMKTENDLTKINYVITGRNKLDSKSNFNQFLDQKNLFWVDKNYNVVIKNRVGILSYPQKIAETYEVGNSKANSWKLIISKDLPHFQNDYNLILTSFGVTDENGEYMGSIASSIDINLIQDLLIKNLPESSGNLAILNSHNNKITFQSNPDKFISDADFFSHKLGNVNYEQDQSGFIEIESPQHGTKYAYYKKLSNYPLTIVSGYDYKLYQVHLFKLLLKTIYPNIAVGFLLIVSLFLFYRRIVKPINNLSSIARKIGSNQDLSDQKFPKKINSPEIFNLSKALMRIKFQRAKLEKSNFELMETKNQLEEAIDVIRKSDIAQIEIIKQIKKDISKNTAQVFQVLGMLKYNLESQISPNVKLNLFLINSLEQGIANITKFATDELNKEFVDVHRIINRAVLSQEKEIKIRNIRLEVFYDAKLPKKIFVDQIRLIQILSSILHKTILLLSEENMVKIFVKTTVKNKKKNLSVRIEDDGMGIGFKEYISDAKKFGGKEESSVNGIDISVETIEELVALHQGEIVYDNKIQYGSSTTIILPCIKQIKKNPPASSKKAADNLIYFPVRNENQ
jgi:signal transduction histidine kinase